jgi:hypothetical protein
LNLGYLKEKGYYLKAVKCDGRCGKNHNTSRGERGMNDDDVVQKYLDREQKSLRRRAYELAREYCPTHKDTQHIFVDGYMAALKDLPVEK